MTRGPAMPAGVVLKPLRWPGTILNGESLLGVVTRRSAEHFFGANHIVLRACGLDLRHQGNALIEASPDNILELSRILRVDQEKLKGLVCELVNTDFTGGLVRWGNRTMRLRDIELRFRRISPIALMKSDHHRHAWHCRLLPYCPETFEELIARCPACERSLRWTLAKPIGYCDERTCEFGEKPINSTDRFLPLELRSGYSFLADLLSNDPVTSDSARQKLHRDLRELDNSALIDLLLVMARIDRPAGEPVTKKTAKEEECLDLAGKLVAGREAILQWPNSFEKVCAHAIDHRDRAPHLWPRLKSVASKHPNITVRSVFLNAVPALSEGFREAASPARPLIMLQTELVKRTGIPARQGALLSQGNYLRVGAGPDDPGSRKFDAALAEEFIAQHRNSLPNSSAANCLGLPSYAIIQLRKSGELEPASNPGILALNPDGRIMKASLDAFTGKLGKVLRVFRSEGRLLTLSSAACIFGGGPKPWDKIIGAILAGAIPCFLGEGRRITTTGLMVREVDLQVLRRLPNSHIAPDNFPGLLTKSDVQEILNLSHESVRALEKSGFLRFERAGRGLACPSGMVLELARERISYAEILIRSGFSAHEIRRIASENNVPTLDGGGWCRATMTALIPEIAA